MLYRSDDVGRQYQRNVNKYKTWLDLVEVIAKLAEEREKTRSKQKECYASQHMSRDFYYYFLRISSGSNIVTKRFLFRFFSTKH